MTASPIHLIINEIRQLYGGKEVSMIDVRIIENLHQICSLINTRNNGSAFIRITSFGLEGTVYEDVVFDYTGIVSRTDDIHTFIFTLSKALYELVYGVHLIDDKKALLQSYKTPNSILLDQKLEIVEIKAKLLSLENQLIDLKNKNNNQISLFDYDGEEKKP